VAGVPMARSSGWEIETATSTAALKFINKTPILKGLPIIAIVEAAPGIAASHISKDMDDYALKHKMRLNYMFECPDGSLGVLKNKIINVQYRYCLEFVLKNNSLAYATNVATLHPTNTPMREIERLGEMILGYHYDDKLEMITSKVDRNPDDILSAVNQLLFNGNIFWASPKYKKIREQIILLSQCDFPWVCNGAFRPKMKL
jgi:hypothetical protein